MAERELFPKENRRIIVIGVPSNERVSDGSLMSQADLVLRSLDYEGLSKVTEVVVGTDIELSLGHRSVKVIDYGDDGNELYSRELKMTRDDS